ncbi:MAG: NAD(+)/NADH kinase [Akkermansia sp.]|nr:NAD(+)/NADH kinase [Akkermansia sp.]
MIRIQRVAFHVVTQGFKNDSILEHVKMALRAAGIEVCSYDSKSLEKPDILICLGGDGTMLTVAAEAARRGIMLAGINTGHLGFLTTCGNNEYKALESAIIHGTFTIQERSMLEIVRCSGQTTYAPSFALNEVALMRAQTGRMIDVDVELDGCLLNCYHADGVLVATPTGSTAYSLSAGGALLWPTADVFTLTPICSHSLNSRPVVVPDSLEITLRPCARRGRAEESIIYSIDGQSAHNIEVNDSLTIRKAGSSLKLLCLPNFDYAKRLRGKMGW